MLGFINENGDRIGAVVFLSLVADLPLLADDLGNMLVDDKGEPLLVVEGD